MKNSVIHQWIAQKYIDDKHVGEALELAGEQASVTQWKQFLKQSFFILGILSLCFGVIFFFAYNWSDLSRTVKFTLAQSAIVIVTLCYIFLAKTDYVKRTLLVANVLLIGALLALFGQTYQTGADPWQLFATWAGLTLPLVILGRSEGLWLLWFVLINTAIMLYIEVHNSLLGFTSDKAIWPIVVINILGVLLLEFLVMQKGKVSLQYRWGAQVLSLGVFWILSMMFTMWVFDGGKTHIDFLLGYLVLMAGAFYLYRFILKDLFSLTIWSMSLGFSVCCLAGKYIGWDAGSFLFMGLLILGVGYGAVVFLKSMNKKFEQEAQGALASTDIDAVEESDEVQS